MPAKKIIEAVASTLTVIGSSMATATAGPMPGSTPTAVPIMQPTKAHSRLTGVAAGGKPCISRSRVSAARRPYSQPVRVRRGRVGERERAGGGRAGGVDGRQLRNHPERRRCPGHTDQAILDPGPQAQVEL